MSDEESRALQEQNYALNEQLKRLVRSDRELFMSQRALEVQLSRVRHLNAFTLAASQAGTPTEIALLALQLVTKIFPFEQTAALWREAEGFRVAAIHANPGAEKGAAERIGEVGAISRGQIPLQPVLWSEGDANEAATPFLELLSELYQPTEPGGRSAVQALVLPLLPREGVPLAVLIARRLAGPLPFHDPMPVAADRDLLEVVSRQVAVALANLSLVHDLRHSYEKLAVAQTDLVEKERLAAVGELAAQMAHEVRNPLGALYNSISRLRRVVEPTGEAGTLLGIMSEEANRLNRIVSDLLEFARPHAPVLIEDQVGPTVDQAAAVAGRILDTSELSIVVSAASELPLVAFDERMLEQVMVNLMLNAAQAMEERGCVNVVLRREPLGSGECVRIDVTDAGPGVDPDIAERLFEPFATARASGTGLGLAVVRRYVDALEGEVFFSSDGSSGTTFSVRLPAVGCRDSSHAVD